MFLENPFLRINAVDVIFFSIIALNMNNSVSSVIRRKRETLKRQKTLRFPQISAEVDGTQRVMVMHLNFKITDVQHKLSSRLHPAALSTQKLELFLTGKTSTTWAHIVV